VSKETELLLIKANFIFNRLWKILNQNYCAKNGSNRFCCTEHSHCNETCEVFDCKVVETRPQVSYFYYLHASFCV